MLGCNLRALEFYSGIGGQHYGIRIVAPEATIVGAFEVHNIANDVYEHNFGWRPTQINLEGITAEALDKFKADIWLMSPPCQPFTRRGLQLHAADRRSASFLNLLDLLPTLKHPPSYVLVENVVGFDKSPMRTQLHDTLALIGLSMQEFLVTPLHLGIPYSRPRYYALGRRKHADGSCSFPVPSLPSDRPYAGPPGSLLQAVLAEKNERSTNLEKSSHTDQKPGVVQHAQLETDSAAISPISEFLDKKAAPGQVPTEDRAALADSHSGFGRKCQPLRVQSEAEQVCAQRAHSLQATAGTGRADADSADSMLHNSTPSAHHCIDGHRTRAGLGNGTEGPRPNDAVAADQQAQGSSNRVEWVPQNVMQQWGQSLDIVGPESKRCNCFTKTYFRWVKGSGSVLATKNLHLVKERDSMHAWDLSDEGGIHEHSQFLHLKLRKTVRLRASDRGTGAEGEVNLAADENDHASQSSDDRACNVSTEDCRAQPYERSGLTKEEISCLGLRYFGPSEIARLHSFPEGFSFPKHVTLRQQYALLGNSVSALVIGDLLKYLLHGSESQVSDTPVNF